MASATFTARLDPREVRAITAALAGVKAGVANRVVKAAVAKVARGAAKQAKKLAPVGDSGLLRKSIGVKFLARKRAGTWEYRVGPRRGFARKGGGRGRDPVRYAHLAEFGRKAVAPKKKKALAIRPPAGGVVVRRKAGAAAGRPFITPTWRDVQTRGTARIAADVRAGVAREAAKYKARGKSIYAR